MTSVYPDPFYLKRIDEGAGTYHVTIKWEHPVPRPDAANDEDTTDILTRQHPGLAWEEWEPREDGQVALVNTLIEDVYAVNAADAASSLLDTVEDMVPTGYVIRNIRIEMDHVTERNVA